MPTATTPSNDQTTITPDPNEPAGKTAPRSYRVLVLETHVDGQDDLWIDQGWHPATSTERAIRHARHQIPEVRTALANGQSVVAVPESYFEPMTVGIETVEKEVFKKVKA